MSRVIRAFQRVQIKNAVWEIQKLQEDKKLVNQRIDHSEGFAKRHLIAWIYTVWKFNNFSTFQILREINCLDLKTSKWGYKTFETASFDAFCKINGKNDFTKNLSSSKFLKYTHCVLWISIAFNSFFHLGRPHSRLDFLHISNLYALCAFCSTNTGSPIQIGSKLKTYVPLLDTLYEFGCS